MSMDHVWALTTTSSRLTSPLQYTALADLKVIFYSTYLFLSTRSCSRNSYLFNIQLLENMNDTYHICGMMLYRLAIHSKFGVIYTITISGGKGYMRAYDDAL
jgi:hypothetical protein